MSKLFALYNKSYHSHPLITLACVNGIFATTSDTLAQSIILLKSSSSQKQSYFWKPPPKTTTDEIIEKIDETLPAPQNRNHLIPDKVSPKADSSNKFDLLRLGRFASYGFMIAPVLHTWFSFLDKKFPLPTGVSPISDSIKTKTKANNPIISQTMKAVFKRVAVDQIVFAPFGLFLFFGVIGILERRDIISIKHKFEESYIPALKANYTVWPLAQIINFRFLSLKYRIPFLSTVGIFWTCYLSLLNSEDSPENNNFMDLLSKSIEY
ncbi:4630_t:CDS:2 [Acaulospora morrowiae]|uniref:4630_t:CDS:1 n=1 Tax=Acaulospora morrowiae TaxID=94023 RepID=A0A9N9D346_9GLOM|nr:4630_t:CDS:2 [Acaulospora morrowiae]